MKNKIAEIRKAKRMTQVQLAEAAGVAETQLQAYERNRRLPGIEIAIRIAKALNTTVEDVFILDD